MRNGFSFVEVLVSVAILSLLGSALLKFNSFNKRMMEKTLISQKNILLYSSVLYMKDLDKKGALGKTMTLMDVVSFNNISDNDRKFLKSHSFDISVKKQEKVFLFASQDGDSYIDNSLVDIQKDGNTIQYLLLKRPK